MNKKDVNKWVDTAEKGSSVIYYSGNLAEDRCYAGTHFAKDVADIPNAFAAHARDKTIEFFPKKKNKNG